MVAATDKSLRNREVVVRTLLSTFSRTTACSKLWYPRIPSNGAVVLRIVRAINSRFALNASCIGWPRQLVVWVPKAQEKRGICRLLSLRDPDNKLSGPPEIRNITEPNTRYKTEKLSRAFPSLVVTKYLAQAAQHTVFGLANGFLVHAQIGCNVRCGLPGGLVQKFLCDTSSTFAQVPPGTRTRSKSSTPLQCISSQ